ncbi:hypothetical protein QA942_41245 [Streptomyces sp. B21-106]|uniref:hypothetical protein n=1 Tax=Streptomyces sp. B21-106 TaxID=3039418 RepID=UPI002FF2B479
MCKLAGDGHVANLARYINRKIRNNSVRLRFATIAAAVAAVAEASSSPPPPR